MKDILPRIKRRERSEADVCLSASALISYQTYTAKMSIRSIGVWRGMKGTHGDKVGQCLSYERPHIMGGERG